MVKRRLALIALALLVSPIWSQSTGGVTVEPRSSVSAEFPQLFDDLYIYGASASAGVRLAPTRLDWLGFGLDLRYVELALQGGYWFDLNAIGPEFGLDFRYSPLTWLSIQLRLAGGGALAWTYTDVLPYSDRYAVGATGRIGTGVLFRLGRLTLGLETDLHGLFGLSTSLSLGIQGGWTLGRSNVPAERAEPLETHPEPLTDSTTVVTGGKPTIGDIVIPPVFPVMRKYYSEHPIGTVVIANETGAPVEDVVVKIDMPGFIDTALTSARFDLLPAGAREDVDLLAIFNETVLGITESERVPATVSVDYVSNGTSAQVSEVVPVEFHDRNTLTWDDNSKAAMFVTARDPEVKMWAGNLSASVTNLGNAAIDPHLQHAIMMHTAIAEAGLAYGPDPATPYAKISEDPYALDYVQFPFQTLSVRTGDCDDLSVLYATLLQAAGQATAFVVTPGHIFVAVLLDADPDEAMQRYLAPEDLIVRGGDVWLPIEVTQVREDFLQAWSTGAREWRESAGRGEAELIPLSEAWETYPSVAFSVTRTDFSPPDEEAVVEGFTEQLRQLVRREIAPRETALRDRLAADPASDRDRNRLGVLYARYGLLDEAEDAFEEAAVRAYSPAITNLANLAFLRGHLDRAEESYQRALELDPVSAAALLGLARVSYEQENYGLVREYYSALERAAPEVAERYAYLSPRGDVTARAADAAALASTVEWEEKP